jgi:Dullard-like phosphatase family protein
VIESLRRILSFGYDIICYTASVKQYADVILDYIDVDKNIFSKRLYRQNCIRTKMGNEKVFIKDLRIFNEVDIKDIIIIDNSALSFALNLDNGIPILPFYDNKNDTELLTLANYLKELVNSKDIRIDNRKFIKYDQEDSSEKEDETSEMSSSEQDYVNKDYLSLMLVNNQSDRSTQAKHTSAKNHLIKKNYNEFQNSFNT